MDKKFNIQSKPGNRKRRVSPDAFLDSLIQAEVVEHNDLLTKMVKLQRGIIRDQGKIISDLEGSLSVQENVVKEVEEASDEALTANHVLRVQVSNLVEVQKRSDLKIADLEDENTFLSVKLNQLESSLREMQRESALSFHRA